MTRATQTTTAFLAVALVYFSCFLGYIPLPSTVQDDVLPVLPLWAIVSLGAYLLFKLGYGVFSFNDVPEAHEELMKQIEQAKTDLRRRGVTVD